MYRAVYKCRLCNEKIEIDVTNQKAKLMAQQITGADPFTPETELKIIHKCANNSKGIMDLLGFTFYGSK